MKAEVKLILAMLIFGSIGIFVKHINLPSLDIVVLRTLIGSAFLGLVFFFTNQSIESKVILKNLPLLICAGLVLGGNWVFLFEAYRYTSVSIATLLYYTAPVVVFLLSPLIFKEKMTLYKTLGIIITVVGMLIINSGGVNGKGGNLGMLYGLISALLYGLIMIINKLIKDLSGLESTFIQLLIAGVIMLSYALILAKGPLQLPRGLDLILVTIVGVVHTGLACYLYFSSMKELAGQTIAIMSYIDPASALIFSAIFLQERLSIYQIIGAFMILGGTAFSQKMEKKRAYISS